MNVSNIDYVHAPSGLILPSDIAEARYASRAITGIDLFAGAGGFSLGFIQAGFEVVAAVDDDPACAVTYMVNLCRWGEFGLHFVTDGDRARLEKYLAKEFKRAGLTDAQGELLPGSKLKGVGFLAAGTGWIAGEPRSTPGVRHFIFGDVTKLTGKLVLDMIGMERGDVGCVFGGPPCQGFSFSGKRSKDDPRNNLVLEFVRLVLEINPRTVCLENVPGIASMTTADGFPILDLICDALEKGSFGSYDMLRKMIAFQTGNVGFMRKRGTKSGRAKKPKGRQGAKR